LFISQVEPIFLSRSGQVIIGNIGKKTFSVTVAQNGANVKFVTEGILPGVVKPGEKVQVTYHIIRDSLIDTLSSFSITPVNAPDEQNILVPLLFDSSGIKAEEVGSVGHTPSSEKCIELTTQVSSSSRLRAGIGFGRAAQKS
jgi:hypothetical protein